jgi:hypothetical protein
VLVGHAIARLADGWAAERRLAWRIPVWATVGGVLVVGLAGLAATPFVVSRLGERRDLIAPCLVGAVALATGGAWAVAQLCKQRLSAALAAVAAGAALAYLVALTWALPLMDDPLSAKADAQWLDAETRQEAGEVVGALDDSVPKEAPALSFYGRVRIVALATAAEARAHLRRQPNGVLLAKRADDPRVLELAEFEPVILRRMQIGSDEVLALRMRPRTRGAGVPTL